MKRMVFLVLGTMMMLVGQSQAQSSIPSAGLQLWLRADAGVDTLNGTVSRWHDQSGNGHDAFQANASRQPLLVASALNGKPVVRFDGLNDKLGFTGSTLMTQFSLFVVLNNHVGTPGNDGNVITFGTNGNFWFMGIPYPSGSDSIGMATGSDSWVRCSKPGLAAHDQWRNLSAVANQTMWSTTLRWDGYTLPMVPGGSNSAISVPLGDATGSGGGIGGTDGAAAGTILAKCDVAEVIVYSAALSDSVRKNIETYLATKYGLPQPPIPTAGLQLWLRSDAGVDTLNGKVSRWRDQSGKGNDAIQFNTVRQPLFIDSALNYRPVLRFDGLDDKLGFTGSTPMSQFTLFMVVKNYSGGAVHNSHVITFGPFAGQPNQGFAVLWGGFDRVPDLILFGNSIGGMFASASNIAVNGEWRIISIVFETKFNTTLRWNGNNATMSVNEPGPSFFGPLGDSTGSGGGIAGGDVLNGNLLTAKCDFTEAIVYDTLLTNSEILAVENYLATKYGLIYNSVVDHHEGNLPEKFVLEQNYPNPFNPTTVVSYQLPVASDVRLVVYDILGREVSVLVNEIKAPGSYSVRFDARGMASGVYFYQLKAGTFVETRKLLLLR